jgi:hypothetical protein
VCSVVVTLRTISSVRPDQYTVTRSDAAPPASHPRSSSAHPDAHHPHPACTHIAASAPDTHPRPPRPAETLQCRPRRGRALTPPAQTLRTPWTYRVQVVMTDAGQAGPNGIRQAQRDHLPENAADPLRLDCSVHIQLAITQVCFVKVPHTTFIDNHIFTIYSIYALRAVPCHNSLPHNLVTWSRGLSLT